MDAFGLHVWGLEAPWRLEAAIWRLGGWMWGAGGPEGGARAEAMKGVPWFPPNTGFWAGGVPPGVLAMVCGPAGGR